MKKALTIILTTLSLVLVLDSLNAGEAMTMFLLAGIIPGTNIVLSGAVMLEFFAFLLGFVLARIAARGIQAYVTYRTAVKPAPNKSRA